MRDEEGGIKQFVGMKMMGLVVKRKKAFLDAHWEERK